MKLQDKIAIVTGTLIFKSFEAHTLEEWDRTMHTNLRSAFLLSQAVVPSMKKQHYGKKGKMTQHHYEQLLVKRGQLNHSWKMAIAENYTIDDLDHEEIRLAVKQGIVVGRVPPLAESESIPSILKSWNLLDGEMLNNASVVLFAKKTLPFYTQCHIKVRIITHREQYYY